MSISNLLVNGNPKSYDLYVNSVNEANGENTQVWELTGTITIPNSTPETIIGPVTANWLRQYSVGDLAGITQTNGVFTIAKAGLYRIFITSIFLFNAVTNTTAAVSYRIQKGDQSATYSTYYNQLDISSGTYGGGNTAHVECVRVFNAGDTVSFTIEVLGQSSVDVLGGATSNGFPTYVLFNRIG